MPHGSDGHGARWLRVSIALGVTILLGVGLLRWSYYSKSAWWSGVLANAGTAFLLLVLGVVYADWHHRALARVEGKTDQAVSRAERAASAAEAATADVEILSEAVERVTAAQTIQEQLRAQQVAEVQRDLFLFDSWRDRADRASTIAALAYGLDVHLISEAGFRMPLIATELHLRFRYKPELDRLTFTVEQDDGAPFGAVTWVLGDQPLSVYGAVEAIIKEAGQHPGAGFTTSTHAAMQAADALRFAVEMRATPIVYGDVFRDLVEFTGDNADEEDGWYISERAVFPRAHPSYVIGVKRLSERLGPNEPSWEEHVANKGWGGGSRAFEIARALNHLPDPSLRASE